VTDVLIIGDIVRTPTGFDMIIGFTPDDKVLLDMRGLSDEQYFDVIGHYDPDELGLVLYDNGT
jgi:hypothetical protein